jgi:hypothetical protein
VDCANKPRRGFSDMLGAIGAVEVAVGALMVVAAVLILA